jgi:hypothetical protein
LAIADYCEGLPPIVGHILNSKIPVFVEALIDDAEVRQAALDFYNEAEQARKSA